MALSWRFGRRSKLRIKVSQDPEDFYRLDPKKSATENAYDIYKMLCCRDTRDTKRLYLLNAITTLCVADAASTKSSLQFSTEEWFFCLSASLVHNFTQVRAAALRAIRYVLATSKDIKIFNSMQLQHLLCRSIDLMLKNDDERVQALKLIRKMLAISPEDISPVVVRCLVSLADSGAEESDNLLRVCLATLCEFAVLNPTLLIVCGGVTSITRNVLECHNPRIAESLCGVLLYLLEWPQTRNICGVRLDCLAAPYCDFTYRLGIMDKNKDARELRYTSCRLALLSVLRSWTGTLEFCDPSKPSGLKAIVDALYLNQIEVRKAILDLLYELLRLPQPPWTNDYAVALQTVDPSDFQDSWLLPNGFVAAEGRSILPSLAARAVSIVNQHLALLLYCFLETGLLNALVEVIVSRDQHVSVRATVLVGKIIQLMHTHLPADICSTSPALPTLIAHATQGNQRATAAISALQTYQQMLRLRPASCSLFLDSIIKGGALIQTRLFRRDINTLENTSLINSPNMTSATMMTGTAPAAFDMRSMHGDTFDRHRLDSVSSSDESTSQSSSLRSSFRLKRKFLPFFDNMRSMTRLIKDSNVLSLTDGLAWDWDVVATILRSNLIRKIDDTTCKFLKRLVDFFKPSNNRFSHQDLVYGHAMPAYVAAGNDLIDVLLNSNELECMRMITDYFSDISQHLLAVASTKCTYNCLFSPQHMSNTMCQQYFLYIGRMCRTSKGISILTNTTVFGHLINLVRNTDHVCYVKLIVSGLDYSAEPMPRKVLEKALTVASTRSGRLYATQFLAVLLRARLPNFEVWGIPLIIQQTKDPDHGVVLAAMDVLEEACHEKYYLEEIVSLWPNLKAHGDAGRLLMSRYYSLSRGLNHSKAKIKDEIEYWKNGYNKRYALLIEADTHASLTLHVRNDDGTYSHRNCNTRPVIPSPNIAAHLYGQMVQTTQGMTALRKYGDLPHLIEVVTRGKCADDADCLELKAAIWAVSHASTHTNGVEYFIESGSRIYEKLILLVTKCEVYSIRATCFNALGVISATQAGANLLFKLNWLSVRHDRNTTWPVHQPEDWMSCNYTPVRHHYEDMPPYNYTGIEDQIDGSYYTGSYWNLLLNSNSTTKGDGYGAGGPPSASSEAHDANTTTDSVRTMVDETASAAVKSTTTAAAVKSKTLPEGTYLRQSKHQRSLSESKTTDIISLIGAAAIMPGGHHQQHRIRYNSCTDSNTSGVSSCESVTGRTAAIAVGDFQQFPLSPIPSMSNLIEMPQQDVKLLRRTTLMGPPCLQQTLTPLDVQGYAQLRSLRAGSRPIFSESAADFFDFIDIVYPYLRPRKSSFGETPRRIAKLLNAKSLIGGGSRGSSGRMVSGSESADDFYDFIDIADRSDFGQRKSSFGESQARLKVRSLDRQASLNVFTRLSAEEMHVPLPRLNTPKFLSQNDSQGPCYAGICLPKNPFDIFPTRNHTRTYVSRDIQDHDLLDINSLTAKQQFLNDSLNNQGGDDLSVISSLSDVSSVSKRSKWHQVGAKHGRSQCLQCSRSRLRRSQQQRTQHAGCNVGIGELMQTTSAANGLPPAPCELYSSATAALMAAGLQATVAMSRKNLKQQQQQQYAQKTQSSSTIQLSDISFHSPESIFSDESLADQVTASILYNIQRLANPVSAKQSKMSLLELKQKHPLAFQDICLYSEACKTLGRCSYRMNARRFLQELFLDLSFDAFYAEPQEILGKKSKLVGAAVSAASSATASASASASAGTMSASASAAPMAATAERVASDFVAPAGQTVMDMEQSMLNAVSSVPPAPHTALSITQAVHMSQLKSKPLASVYETSCENLLMEQSPRLSSNDETSMAIRRRSNELHIASDESDDKGGTDGSGDVDKNERGNDVEDTSTTIQAGEDVCDGCDVRKEAAAIKIATADGAQIVTNRRGRLNQETGVPAATGNVYEINKQRSNSKNPPTKTRTSFSTVAPATTAAPTAVTAADAAGKSTVATTVVPSPENENKKYTRGRFYTLELDLSCTKNKFPITNRTHAVATSTISGGGGCAVNSVAAATTVATVISTTPITFTFTSPQALTGIGKHNDSSGGGGGGGGGDSLPMYTRQSSFPSVVAVHDTEAPLLMMVAPTLSSLTVTKSLAASMVKPVGSLFCEKRLQTSKSEAVLMNVINTTTNTCSGGSTATLQTAAALTSTDAISMQK